MWRSAIRDGRHPGGNFSRRRDSCCGSSVNCFLAIPALKKVKWALTLPGRFSSPKLPAITAAICTRAKAFVDAAADAGCDAVKFQLFKIDRMFAPEILAQSSKHRARKEWELPLSHLGAPGRTLFGPENPVFLHPFLPGGGGRTGAFCRFLQGRILRASGRRPAQGLRRHRKARGPVHRHGHHG